MPERHRWSKPREHLAVCVKCGCRCLNVKYGPRKGDWAKAFETAAGDKLMQDPPRVPPCEPHPTRTEKILKFYGLTKEATT